jgi:hypothetical protein
MTTDIQVSQKNDDKETLVDAATFRFLLPG